jgi:hypothetical protein
VPSRSRTVADGRRGALEPRSRRPSATSPRHGTDDYETTLRRRDVEHTCVQSPDVAATHIHSCSSSEQKHNTCWVPVRSDPKNRTSIFVRRAFLLTVTKPRAASATEPKTVSHSGFRSRRTHLWHTSQWSSSSRSTRFRASPARRLDASRVEEDDGRDGCPLPYRACVSRLASGKMRRQPSSKSLPWNVCPRCGMCRCDRGAQVDHRRRDTRARRGVSSATSSDAP